MFVWWDVCPGRASSAGRISDFIHIRYSRVRRCPLNLNIPGLKGWYLQMVSKNRMENLFKAVLMILITFLEFRRRDNAVGIATGCGLNGLG
jgi:hypothetical protein